MYSLAHTDAYPPWTLYVHELCLITRLCFLRNLMDIQALLHTFTWLLLELSDRKLWSNAYGEPAVFAQEKRRRVLVARRVLLSLIRVDIFAGHAKAL